MNAGAPRSRRPAAAFAAFRRRSRGRLAALFLAILLGGSCGGGPSPGAVADGFVIVNARLVDGSGGPSYPGGARIREGRIEAVGAEVAPRAGETVVDAGGRVLAPGFVDTHSHADRDLFDHPDALAAVSQGITTVVVGQDGGSHHPLAEFRDRLRENPPTVHVAAYSGHNTLRRLVLGEDYRRRASPEEVAAMQALLEADLAAGALGLSTGLEYDPGIYSDTAEVVALARTAAAAGGRYLSHLRSEDRYFREAVEEIVAIGREAALPVQITHAKLAMRSLRGEVPWLLDRLERARAEGVEITLDVYPYPYWQSTLTVLFPDRDFTDLEEARFVVSELAAPEDLFLPHYTPEPAWAGRTLAEIAAERGEEPAAVLLDLIRRAEERRADPDRDPREIVESVIATGMNENDIAALFAWEHANLSTDGALRGAHPRGFGSFPRALRQFVRERGLVTLEEAVRKMTSLAVEHLGLAGRGLLAPGFAADLVLFDPETVTDHATPEEPHALSTGIHRVFVAGETVFREGRVTAARPGRFLTR